MSTASSTRTASRRTDPPNGVRPSRGRARSAQPSGRSPSFEGSSLERSRYLEPGMATRRVSDYNESYGGRGMEAAAPAPLLEDSGAGAPSSGRASARPFARSAVAARRSGVRAHEALTLVFREPSGAGRRFLFEDLLQPIEASDLRPQRARDHRRHQLLRAGELRVEDERQPCGAAARVDEVEASGRMHGAGRRPELDSLVDLVARELEVGRDLPAARAVDHLAVR